MRKNMYQWHRTLSLIIAIPVVLWAASGFMHPIMTTIRPRVATQFLQPTVIDSAKIKVSLTEALQKNNMAVFHNFRLVAIEKNWFYRKTFRSRKIKDNRIRRETVRIKNCRNNQ